MIWFHTGKKNAGFFKYFLNRFIFSKSPVIRGLRCPTFWDNLRQQKHRFFLGALCSCFHSSMKTGRTILHRARFATGNGKHVQRYDFLSDYTSKFKCYAAHRQQTGGQPIKPAWIRGYAWFWLSEGMGCITPYCSGLRRVWFNLFLGSLISWVFSFSGAKLVICLYISKHSGKNLTLTWWVGNDHRNQIKNQKPV